MLTPLTALVRECGQTKVTKAKGDQTWTTYDTLYGNELKSKQK